MDLTGKQRLDFIATREALRSPNEHRAVPCPRPGGEPLCSAAVLSDGSRRLPGITQRVLLPGGLCCEGIDQRGR